MERYTKICPKCGSTNITVGGFKHPTFHCGDCGHGGGERAFFPEVLVNEVESFRKNLKRKK